MSKPKPATPTIPDDNDPPTVEIGPPAGKREEAVRAGVLKALGRPPELLRVAVMPLWKDHFRVNVLTGSISTVVSIPNSYFVTADAAGKILRASPPILKQY